MGLETVEIVLWAEEEFGVSMPDEEVGGIFTVGEFSEYIGEKVDSTLGISISRDDILGKITDLLVNDYGIERDKIKPSSKFVQDLGLD